MLTDWALLERLREIISNIPERVVSLTLTIPRREKEPRLPTVEVEIECWDGHAPRLNGREIIKEIRRFSLVPEGDEAHAVLVDLVACKSSKEKLDALAYLVPDSDQSFGDDWRRQKADYEAKKEAAWKRARRYLGIAERQ